MQIKFCQTWQEEHTYSYKYLFCTCAALDFGFTLVTSVISKSNDAHVWKTIYFLTLILMGIGTHSVYVQNIVSALLHFLPDRWRFRWKIKCSILAGVCCVAMVIGLLLTSQVILLQIFFFYIVMMFVLLELFLFHLKSNKSFKCTIHALLWKV